MKVWSCKIGEVADESLPSGADAPMRDAVAKMYRRMTDREPAFIFSGWGADLDESERAVVEDRLPDPAVILRDLQERVAIVRPQVDGSGEPLWRGPVEYLLTAGEAIRRAHPDGGSVNEVEVWRAGDRPVPPTREQLMEAITNRVMVSSSMLGRISDNDVDTLVNAVWDLLSGGVPTEPEETP